MRAITNVSAGRVSAGSTDAVNGAQLYAVQEGTRAAVAGLSQQISAVNFDLQNLKRDTDASIASTAALTTLPQSIHPVEFVLSMGTALRACQMGVALGLSYRTPDDRVTFNARIANDRRQPTPSLALASSSND